VRLLYRLPVILPGMKVARIERIYAAPGSCLEPGAKLMDLRIDLSGSVAHDCPPVSFFRLVMRERAWLTRLASSSGEEVAVDAPLAWFSTDPNEEQPEGEPERPARIAHTGILAPITPAADWLGR
jgi:hypothetical protein